MHEFSLLKDLLGKIKAIAEENASDKVISVKVKLGALAHISPEHFREHFDNAVVGTSAEGAKLEIETLTDMSDPHAQEVILDSVELAVK
jgi:hydrogenase nickel incorporation protein HypA/HybF